MVLHVNNSLNGCYFFLATRSTIVCKSLYIRIFNKFTLYYNSDDHVIIYGYKNKDAVMLEHLYFHFNQLSHKKGVITKKHMVIHLHLNSILNGLYTSAH